MIARNMLENRLYKRMIPCASDEAVPFEFSHVSGDGKWAIVHPEGEPDMQSCWGIPVDTEVEEIPTERTKQDLEHIAITAVEALYTPDNLSINDLSCLQSFVVEKATNSGLRRKYARTEPGKLTVGQVRLLGKAVFRLLGKE